VLAEHARRSAWPRFVGDLEPARLVAVAVDRRAPVGGDAQLGERALGAHRAARGVDAPDVRRDAAGERRADESLAGVGQAQLAQRLRELGRHVDGVGGRGRPSEARSSSSGGEGPTLPRPPRPGMRQRRARAEALLDAQRLVPLRHALAARERADLELAGAPADREVDDRRVLGLAGARRRRCRRSRARGAASQAARVSLSVPRWFGLSSTVLAAPAAAAWRTSAASLTRKSSPTICSRSPAARVKRANASASSSPSGSSIETIG
jgi:hypothetical protein